MQLCLVSRPGKIYRTQNRHHRNISNRFDDDRHFEYGAIHDFLPGKELKLISRQGMGEADMPKNERVVFI